MVVVFLLLNYRDFPGGPEVGNLPCNVRAMSLTPGQGTKIPHARGHGALGKNGGGGSQPAPESDAAG